MSIIDELPLSAALPRKLLEGASGLMLQPLDHLCRDAFGMTVRQYWDRRRLRHAPFELRSPAASGKEIAMRLGFVRLSHFSRWFKRHTGLPPRIPQDSQKLEPSPQ